MKNAHIGHLVVVTIIVLLTLFWGCKKIDSYNYIVSSDKTKPDIVMNIKVKDFPGGAYITYTLPKSDNLLYILAEYKINDCISQQTKSSYYNDTIKVEGFAKSKDYEVTLYAVSRAEIKSDPVIVKVHPDAPAYLSVFSSEVFHLTLEGYIFHQLIMIKNRLAL